MRQKGFDRLLRAFSKVVQSGLQLVILGDGKERASLLAISQELGSRPICSFPEWYRTSMSGTDARTVSY